MAKIEARRVLGAKNCSDLTNPEAVAQLGDELDGEFQIYPDLDRLVKEERGDERRAQGYGKVTGRKVTDRMLRQALRRAVGQ